MSWSSVSKPEAPRGHTGIRAFGAAFTRGWREKGPLHFFAMAVAGVLPERLFACSVLQIIVVDLPIEIPEDVKFDDVRWGRPDEVELLATPGIPREWVLSNFAKGNRVVLREWEGHFVSCSWYDTSIMELPLFRISLRPGDVYGFGAFTSRELRGRHLHRPVRWYARQAFEREGYKRIVAAVHSTNRSSRQISLGEGNPAIGRIAYLSVLGFTIARVGRHWRFGRVTRCHKIDFPIDATQMWADGSAGNHDSGFTDPGSSHEPRS